MKQIIRKWLGLDGEVAIDAVQATVASLNVGPDDLLVLSTEQTLSPHEASQLRDRLEEVLASGRRTMVLTNGLKLQVVKRAASQPR